MSKSKQLSADRITAMIRDAGKPAGRLRHVWREAQGRVKFVAILDLEDGSMRDPQSCLIKEPIVSRYFSIHETEEAAYSAMFARLRQEIADLRRRARNAESQLKRWAVRFTGTPAAQKAIADSTPKP